MQKLASHARVLAGCPPAAGCQPAPLAVRRGFAGGTSGGAVKGGPRASKGQMDAAREKFLTPVTGAVDHLHAEFVRMLANGDAALLGPGYPGPLV